MDMAKSFQFVIIGGVPPTWNVSYHDKGFHP